MAAPALWVVQLLKDCGYQHAHVVTTSFEDHQIVALFTVPHGANRRALTAFIKGENEHRPQLDVRAGFVIE